MPGGTAKTANHPASFPRKSAWLWHHDSLTDKARTCDGEHTAMTVTDKARACDGEHAAMTVTDKARACDGEHAAMTVTDNATACSSSPCGSDLSEDVGPLLVSLFFSAWPAMDLLL